MRFSYLPYLLLLIQPIFMGSNLIIARGAVGDVPPISLAFWRWLIVFFLLLPFAYKHIINNTFILKKEYLKIFFLGFTGCGICGAFPFIAGQTTTVTNMGIIYTSSPIFIILLSILFFNEKFNFYKIVGLASCLTGVFIIIIKGDINILINLQFAHGDLWMLGASISYALYSIYLLNWKSEYSFFVRLTLIAFFGTLSLFPFYLLEEIYILNNTQFNKMFFFWTSFAALSPGIIAYTLYAKIQKHLGASITGFTLYLFTVYGAVFGIIFFDETLQNFHYLGALLVFVGVYFVNKKLIRTK